MLQQFPVPEGYVQPLSKWQEIEAGYLAKIADLERKLRRLAGLYLEAKRAAGENMAKTPAARI